MNERIRLLAEQAGISVRGHYDETGSTPMELQKFAALVAAHEREACAQVCDVLAVHPEYASDITKVAAQAIRARGEQ
jgi:hypothetical protein